MIDTTLSTSATASRSPSGAGSTAPSAAEMGDRFLKLLVAQMKNQDPLNPLDNAEVTSQMAQISTVQSLEKLNTGNLGMASSLQSLLALQAASVVGRGVLIDGNQLVPGAKGQAAGAFDLSGQADRVTVEVLGADGQRLEQLDLGALPAGRHDFSWAVPSGADAAGRFSFRVNAADAGKPVASTPLMFDRVESVQLQGGAATVSLAGAGTRSLDQIKSFN